MELKIRVDVTKWSGVLERFPAALRQALERGLARSAELFRRAVETNIRTPFGPKPLGLLASSVRSELRDESGRAIGRVFLAPPADRYGLFVEVGTRPHFPPLAPLERWVRKRLGVTDDRQAREIAFLVGRKIARRGTAGHFLFERAFQQNQARVLPILEREVRRVLL